MPIVAEWLGAHCYQTNYKPVPVEEHLVCNGLVFPANTGHDGLPKTPDQLNVPEPKEGRELPVREIKTSTHPEFADPVLNAVVSLAHETACAGFGVLVFAGSRAICESDARWISRVMPEPHQVDSTLVEKRMDLLGELRSLSLGVDPVLEETILYGVAFHRKTHTPWLATAGA